MSCKFNWYNLPNEIKNRIGEPLKGDISTSLYQDFLKLNWFNLPVKLNNIFKKLLLEKPDCTDVPYSKFIWFSLNKKAEILCQIKDSVLNCEPEYNFDITALWYWVGVVDQASFVNYLETNNSQIGSNITITSITDFSISESESESVSRIRCNFTSTGTILDLAGIAATIVNACGDTRGLEILHLSGSGSIHSFNFKFNLPTTLLELYLDHNQLRNASYLEAEEWATNQPSFINECTMYFYNTIDSITGTNLEAILLTKNCIIVT